MSDTNQEVENQEATEIQNHEPDAIEVEARESGWVPKDEFHGDPAKWVDAGEFVRRAPLFQKLDLQNRELKELKRGLEALKQHHAQVRETEYKRALSDLKTQKRDALIDGDPDKVIEIDDRLEAVKEAQRKFEVEQAQEAQRASTAEVIHPEFAAWTKRNPWYETSKPMKAFADALGLELRAQGMTPSEVLRQVEAKVKEEFPAKFRNPNREKAPVVEGTSKGGGKGGGRALNESSLTDDERRIMNTFVRTGVMTKEQYMAELNKVKGV
jgi:hypothetical protein